MSKTSILSVRIVSDAKNAVAGFKEAGAGLKGLEDKATKAAKAMSVISAGVVAVGKQALGAASDLEQSTGAVESVFKGQADAIKKFAASAADVAGLSKNQYQEFASVIGSQLKNLGTSQEELVPTTNKLIEMGADLASMFGGTTADAVQALSAVFRGETDPIERYGISIKQSDVNARLAAEGLDGLEGEALRQAETQARLAMLMEQSADATGNFARETDTAAGSAQIAQAHWENAKAALGEALLPVATKVAEAMARIAQEISAHPALFGQVGLAVLGVTGALWGIVGTVKAIRAVGDAINFLRSMTLLARAATIVMTVAQAALNAVMMLNPWVLVAAGIAAVVAILVVAYQKVDWFRNGVDYCIHVIVAGWELAKIGAHMFVEAIKCVADRFGGLQHIGASVFRALTTFVLWPQRAMLQLYKLISAVANRLAGLRFPRPPRWVNALYGGYTPEVLGVPDVMTFLPRLLFGYTPELTAAAVRSPIAFPSIAPAASPTVTNVTVNVNGSVFSDERAIAKAVTSALRTNRLITTTGGI